MTVDLSASEIKHLLVAVDQLESTWLRYSCHRDYYKEEMVKKLVTKLKMAVEPPVPVGDGI
jgi:hypothetical protein